MNITDGRVFVGLGGNLGDSRYYLAQAAELIGNRLNTAVYSSSVYRSEPVEVPDQPWFLNQVVGFAARGQPAPLTLLRILKEIEFQIGRRPTFRYGPRVIDLDLLFYKNWVLESAELMIPHPKIIERSFVLIPLAELDPSFVHPRLGETIGQILKRNSSGLSICRKV